jgi:hypothetical protein
MLTGRHAVRDVPCKITYAKLAWMYEFATEGNQCKKKTWVILGGALVAEIYGIDKHMGDN